MAETGTKTTGLFKMLAGFLLSVTALFDSYRPELYYMRGPGPKWHEKHLQG